LKESALQQKINNIALQGLETVINKVLRLNADNRHLQALDTKVVMVQITNLQLECGVRFMAGQISLTVSSQSISEEAPDAIISSTSAKFIKFLVLQKFSDNTASSDNNAVNSNNYTNPKALQGINFSGDLETAKNLQELSQSIAIDWEEELAKLTNDVIASQIGAAIKKAISTSKTAGSNLTEMLSEYLHFEAQLVPQPEAVAALVRDIDNLRDDVARIGAKLALLSQR
jgi:ubiquinone biosynthesis protein UbiJ